MNVTAYQIDNSNSFLAMTTIQPKRTWNSQAKASAGAIRSKGFEADIMSRPVNEFSVVGGYSYNDTRYHGEFGVQGGKDDHSGLYVARCS